MQPAQWEIAILKPTPVFFSFLASQLPETDMPKFHLLQVDNTAYVMPKQNSEEGTLNEMERHFPVMFRHEISRWLGKEARHDIENRFLDFLCCFKFELHSHLVLMEPSISQGKNALRVKPRALLMEWIKEAVSTQADLVDILERVDLSQLSENATVVVKNFNQLTDIKPFLHNQYQSIFKAEMLRMCNREEEWPRVESYQAFSRYFAIEIHTQLIHLD